MKTFEITRGDSGGTPVLALQGKLTLGEGARTLRQTIDQIAVEGVRNIVLDMGGVTYVDSSGLGSMVAGCNALRPHGGAVGLVNVPKRVQDLLEMTGLTALLRTYSSVDEATRTFQGATG